MNFDPILFVFIIITIWLTIAWFRALKAMKIAQNILNKLENESFSEEQLLAMIARSENIGKISYILKTCFCFWNPMRSYIDENWLLDDDEKINTL